MVETREEELARLRREWDAAGGLYAGMKSAPMPKEEEKK